MGKIKFWNIMGATCKKLWKNDLHSNKIYIYMVYIYTYKIQNLANP
jgi:hypothetical protein